MVEVQIQVSSNLLHNLILFERVLHGTGMPVGTARTMDVANALTHVQIGNRSDFYFTLRALMVNRREDIALFDDAFDAFWRKPEDFSVPIALSEQSPRRREKPILKAPDLKPDADPNDDGSEQNKPQKIIEVTRTYSVSEVMRHKDFSEMSAEEVAAIQKLIASLTLNIALRRTRRSVIGNERALDLRRTIRRNMRYGGEIMGWSHRAHKRKPRPLVILADISGSMERYTRLLLHFVYGISHGARRRVESFTFGTRLTRITHAIRQNNVEIALRDVGRAASDWSGGTRIGETLHTFNYGWGKRVLNGGAVVLVISDGWDRGEPDLLRKEMARLNLNSHRLVWLNPLIGSEDYEPLTRGIQAALPYVDDFLPCHNLASLEELAQQLTQLDARR